MKRQGGKAGAERIHALVVDDSAVVRQFMRALLSNEPGMSVAVAADPIIAMQKMEARWPDVIVLDLEMPRMDGLTFLRQLMKDEPVPVVVCSGHARSGTEAALKALEAGAVEVVAKPQLGLRDFLRESSMLLVDTIRAAAGARVKRRRLPAVEPRLTADAMLAPAKPPVRTGAPAETVVAIGASTGGTEALRELLQAMPADAPGMVIVQHMPEEFTAAFAQRLNGVCSIAVKEAADGDPVARGRALVAPGNRHTMLVRIGTGFHVKVADGPLVCRHRPSVDVLFRSVAQNAGAASLGVILTGMGDDGADGLLEMKQAGAPTLVQDEASSVVFGMPKEAIARNAADEVVPLSRMASAILRNVQPVHRERASTVRGGGFG